MSLIQKKKDGNYYVVYRLDGKQIWYATHTTNQELALSMQDTILKQNSENRLRAQLAELLGEKAPAPVNSFLPAPKKRLKLDDVIQIAQKYRSLSVNHLRAWNRFKKALAGNIKYADQISAEMALSYLQASYGKQKSKSYNNNRTYLNSLFKCVLIDAGISESPFARIRQRLLDDEQHQRPFTEDECKKIINAAPEPWRSAAIIAYYTGLRQMDVFALRWNEIKSNIITTKPTKTARFNRSVQIPIHAELLKWLKTLSRKNERVLGFSDLKCHNSGSFTLAFGKILKDLKISSNEKGLVKFNSFRNTFITRCRKHKIAEHAIRGIAGHTDQEMTDLYSHDLTSAKEILKLPAGKFDLTDKIQ